MKITNIPDVPQTIKTAAMNGKLIVFIGAGASRLLGCPSWTGFAEKHLDALKAAGVINHFVYERLGGVAQRDPRKVLTICNILQKEAGMPKFDVKKMLEGDPARVKTSKLYEYLFSLNAIYVTTNFDVHMDKVQEAQRAIIPPVSQNEGAIAVPQAPAKGKMFFKEKDLLVSTLATSGNIVHLHGSVEDYDSLIITFPQYAKHYEKDSKASVFLQEVFKRNVLFVGYGVEEYEILEYVLQKAGAPKKEDIRHAMLSGAFEGEEELMNHLDRYYRTLGIELVPFSKTKKGHEQLEEVLRVWSEEMVAESPQFLENVKIMEDEL